MNPEQENRNRLRKVYGDIGCPVVTITFPVNANEMTQSEAERHTAVFLEDLREYKETGKSPYISNNIAGLKLQ